MSVNRGLLFWGSALVTAGVVALAVQAGLIDGAALGAVTRYWPVALVVGGIAIVLGATLLGGIGALAAGIVVGGIVGGLVSGAPIEIGCAGGEPTERTAADGPLREGASVSVDFNCGSLEVAVADGEAWSLDARRAGGPEPRVEAETDRVELESGGDGPFTLGGSRHDWSLVVPADAGIDLEVELKAGDAALELDGAQLSGLELDLNAGSATVDLRGARVDDLSVDANAGSVTVHVDGGTDLDGGLSVNAGSLELCAPDDAALAITVEDPNVTFSTNLAESGLVRTGDTWRRAGGGNVAIDVDGNAGSFSLLAEEDC